jgi:uncharacterized protein (DUF1697 family)
LSLSSGNIFSFLEHENQVRELFQKQEKAFRVSYSKAGFDLFHDAFVRVTRDFGRVSHDVHFQLGLEHPALGYHGMEKGRVHGEFRNSFEEGKEQMTPVNFWLCIFLP